MKEAKRALVAFLLIFVCLFSFLGLVEAAVNHNVCTFGPECATIFQIVNKWRAERNVPLLSCDDRLIRAAQIHADQEAYYAYYEYDPFSILTTTVDYKYVVAAETYWFGGTDPTIIMEALKNLPPRRRRGYNNLVNPAFVNFGCGLAYYAPSYYGSYWVLNVARLRNPNTREDGFELMFSSFNTTLPDGTVMGTYSVLPKGAEELD